MTRSILLHTADDRRSGARVGESVLVALGWRSVPGGVHVAIFTSWLRHELFQLAATVVCLELFRRRHHMVLSGSAVSN
jgi:hypothetical protein